MPFLLVHRLEAVTAAWGYNCRIFVSRLMLQGGTRNEQPAAGLMSWTSLTVTPRKGSGIERSSMPQTRPLHGKQFRSQGKLSSVEF